MDLSDAAIAEHYRANHITRRHSLACNGLERLPQYKSANMIVEALRTQHRERDGTDGLERTCVTFNISTYY